HAVTLESYGDIFGTERAFQFNLKRDGDRIELTDLSGFIGGVSWQRSLGGSLAQALRRRLYVFQAERLNITRAAIHDTSVLASDASNLPQVLHRLQSRNTARFRDYNRLVTTIFPDVLQVTAPYIGNEIELQLWPIDPETQREDLAISLAESGT